MSKTKPQKVDVKQIVLLCNREIIAIVTSQTEPCPLCGQTSGVHPKLILIDEGWVQKPGRDPREVYFADLRVDDVQPQNLREHPLEQFIDGFYCDRCKSGFVSETGLKAGRRRYR